MTAVEERLSDRVVVVSAEGRLVAPVNRRLRSDVAAVLRRGERRILLDLRGLAAIDAAGVGELVRTYHLATAVNGQLRVANAPPRVQRVLELVGLALLLRARSDCKAFASL